MPGQVAVTSPETGQNTPKHMTTKCFLPNQDYHTNLRILITTDREKHVLSPEHVSCHIDDKPNLCELIHERGLPVVCLNLAYKQRLGRHYQPPPPFPVVANFQEAIAAVRNFRLVPRVFKVWPLWKHMKRKWK